LYLNGLQTAVRENIKYFLLTSLKENMVRALLFDSSHPSEKQGNRIPNETALNTVNNQSNHYKHSKKNKNFKRNNPNSSNNANNSSDGNQNRKIDANGSSVPGKVVLFCEHFGKKGHTIYFCFVCYIRI
jgi:hypothetical protein